MTVVLDLDGVLWLGDQPLDGAAEAVAELRGAGLGVVFLSNNSSVMVDGYLAKLARFGIPALADEVISSAMAGAAVVERECPPGARVLVVGEDGIREALVAKGFEVVDDDGACDAVIVGICRHFNYPLLDRASAAIRAGARYIATNLDATYPAPGGLVPGAGSMVAAVTAAASGIEPIVAGKPYPPTVELLRARLRERGADPNVGVMVGDRKTTDGALAEALGWPFALVRSDVGADKGELASTVPVAFEADSLADLVGPIVGWSTGSA